MINNNPYNIPEKKPLSQSKIFSETNTSRHSSTYMQNRGNNQIMYNSSIFMKNSSIMNGQTDQPFFQPIREPLSPHSIYPKPSPNAQFIPTYSNVPIRSHEMNTFQVSSHKDMNAQKGLNLLKEKIERIEKRLQAQEKRESLFNEIKDKKKNTSETESVRQVVQENLNNSAVLKSLINSIVQQSFQTQNNKIWLKLKDLDETMISSNNIVSAQKLSRLQDLFLKCQSEKNHDEQFMNRIKTIEKTIRQMGEDIHLVNDKEENISIKIQNELPWIRNEIKDLKSIEKIIGELQNNNNQLRAQIQDILRKLHLLQSTTESSLTCKIQQIQQKIDNMKSSQKDYKASFDRYFPEPIVLKYVQKFQISNQIVSKNSYTNSTKGESCQEILVNEITYFIDSEGYLLDNDRFYLITGIKNQRVRLDMKHIQLLKERKILI